MQFNFFSIANNINANEHKYVENQDTKERGEQRLNLIGLFKWGNKLNL